MLADHFVTPIVLKLKSCLLAIFVFVNLQPPQNCRIA